MKSNEESFNLYKHIAGLPLFIVTFISFSYSINRAFNIPMFRIDDQVAISYKVLLDSLYSLKIPAMFFLLSIVFLYLVSFCFYKIPNVKKVTSELQKKIKVFCRSELTLVKVLSIVSICIAIIAIVYFPILRSPVFGLDPLIYSFLSLIVLPSLYIKIHSIVSSGKASVIRSTMLALLIVIIICLNMVSGMCYFRVKVRSSPFINGNGYLIVALAEQQFSLSCDGKTKGNVYKNLMNSNQVSPILISKARRQFVNWICDNVKPNFSELEYL